MLKRNIASLLHRFLDVIVSESKQILFPHVSPMSTWVKTEMFRIVGLAVGTFNFGDRTSSIARKEKEPER